jgi:hypothetical protein
MTRCTFKQGNYNCGSYAFNLYKEDIDQGSYCDRHYWQDQAQKARAAEREVCIVDIQMNIPRSGGSTSEYQMAIRMIERIRARGQA